MSAVKWIGVSLIVVLLGIQLIRPDRTNPTIDPGQTVDSYVPLPDDIRSILTKACYDCHSHQTIWPWYSQVAPVSWLVARDVREGRQHLNFSSWGTYTNKRMSEKLSQIAGEVEEGSMPMRPYVWLHREADLTGEEKRRLVSWAEEEADRIASGGEGEESGEP